MKPNSERTGEAAVVGAAHCSPVICKALLESAQTVGEMHTLLDRLQRCNERKRALLALPPLKHDMTLPMPERLDTFERLQSERVEEDISIMAEALDVMKQLDALMLANDQAERQSAKNL